LEAMGIDVWRLRVRSNTSAAVSSAGEANEVPPRAAEQQGSVDDGDLINVSPNESGRADSVQVQAEKASSSPEAADVASAAVGDIAASRELHAAFYDYRTLLICVVAERDQEEGRLVQFADDVVRAYNGLEVRSLSRMAWKQAGADLPSELVAIVKRSSAQVGVIILDDTVSASEGKGIIDLLGLVSKDVRWIDLALSRETVPQTDMKRRLWETLSQNG
ncbi:MAG: hypothetical protein VW349_06535, partial [Gammaproteobacteria bacterium]